MCGVPVVIDMRMSACVLYVARYAFFAFFHRMSLVAAVGVFLTLSSQVSVVTPGTHKNDKLSLFCLLIVGTIIHVHHVQCKTNTAARTAR